MATKRTDKRGRILKDGESQREDGTYRFRYTDANGIRRDVYSSRLVPTDKLDKNKKQDLSLREKEQQIRRDLEDGIKARVENRATLNDLFKIYLDGKIELKESTRTTYLYMYNQYVKNEIGNKRISSIKYSDIKAYYNSLIVEKSFSLHTVESVHTVLRPIFAMAVRDGYIRINPTDGIIQEIKRGRNWKIKKRRALSVEEQEAFMSFVREHKTYNIWYPLFAVMLGTGCRIGETIGLRWDDCDFEKGLISINHSLTYRKYEGDSKVTFHIDTPKTAAGIRVVPMLSQVKSALIKEYQKQQIIGFNESVVDGYSGFIFQTRYGNPHTSANVNKAINRICSAYWEQEQAEAKQEGREPLEIRHFSSHNLRHTFCTRFCENETNLKVIQEVMGHSNIRTTMDVYAESTTEKKVASFANLEGKIKI